MSQIKYCRSIDNEFVIFTKLETQVDNDSNNCVPEKADDTNSKDTSIKFTRLHDEVKNSQQEQDCSKERLPICKLTAVTLSLAFFSLGLFLAMIGPSLVDLQHNVGVSFQYITFVFTIRSVGYLFGALIGGILQDRLNAYLILGFSLVGPGVTGYIIPWTQSFTTLLILMLVSGMFLGSIDTGGNTLCVKLWGRKSAPFLQMMYFTGALGGTVSPLLIAAFVDSSVVAGGETLLQTTIPPSSLSALPDDLNTSLSQFIPVYSFDNSEVWNSTNTLPIHRTNFVSELPTQSAENTNNVLYRSMMVFESNNLNIKYNFSTGTTESHVIVLNGTNGDNTFSSFLWIPHFVVSTFSIVVSFPFFLLFLRTHAEKYKQGKETLTVVSQIQHNSSWKISFAEKVQLLSLLGVFLFLCVGHEVVIGGFIYTFALSSQLNFTPQLASYLNSAFWGSFALSRASAVYIATKISPTTILGVDLAGCLIASTLLLALGNNHRNVLWISIIVLGIAVAPIFPASVSWIERRITMTGKTTASFIVAASGSEIVLPWILGILFQKFTLSVMVYVIFSLSVAAIIVFIIMQVRAKKFTYIQVPVYNGVVV
ncbi:sodium-dependent glucose transporter 1A-like [Glandiceps talaboti]